VIEERKIEKLVIGLPLRMDGGVGPVAEKIREFSERLKKELPRELPIIEIDERLTTVIAMEKLHAAGRTEKNSRDRIDQAAAVEILQEYLDSLPTGISDAWDTEIDE
jgi:putative Holliday junction resolvase